jgi:hypothetical protein
MAAKDGYTPGGGAPVAADSIDGQAYQYVKLADPTVDSDAPIGTSANPLVVSVGASSDRSTTLVDGRKTSTTPGTAVALRASLACKWVAVTALVTNTAQVNVGGSGVLGTLGASTGTPLLPGGSITIPVDDASKVFIDPRVSGEGVSFTVGS